MRSGTTAAIIQLFILCAFLAYQGNSRQSPATFLARPSIDQRVFSFRGGGPAAVDSDDDDYDFSEESEEETDEEEEEDDSLVSSTIKSTNKAQTKRTSSAKAAVSSTLAAASSSKTVTSEKKKHKIKLPYIVRAFCNPFTVFAMTKAYFASLFNLEYGKQEPSQDLRSALEEKAKKSTGSSRPKRKMKPGQAKTLSDLPQLNT